MMKLKLSLRNSASLVLFLNILFVLLICGCTSSTSPSYLKETLTQKIQDICKEEYQLNVTATIVGSTLWVYFPVEDLLEKTDKPEKYVEKFSIEANNVQIKERMLTLDYSIKPVPEKEKFENFRYNKKVAEQQNNIWKVIRRVLFSMGGPEKNAPKFLCIVTADIKNGFEIKQIFFLLDIKKVSYGFFSSEEYRHRIAEEIDSPPEIIGDKTGAHLKYKDITLGEFVTLQIQQRIKLKFQKPEVAEKADIDKEILKVVRYTLNTYGFKDFSEVELNNIVTNNKVILNKAAVLDSPNEEKP